MLYCHVLWRILALDIILKNVAAEIRPPSLLSNLYEPLYKGGETVDGSYTLYNNRSRTRCAAMCSQTAECRIYTYDIGTFQCGLLDAIPGSSLATKMAPSTLHTYHLSRMNDKTVVLTATKGSWKDVRQMCSDMDGYLMVPRNTFHAKMLHHIFGEDNLWIGLFRPTSSTDIYNAWIDVKAGVAPITSPEWASRQPNHHQGKQYYIKITDGYKNDFPNGHRLFGLCEV